MAAQITVNQAGKPAGVAGRAREDLDVGTDVTLAASGGPFLSYLWSFVWRPIDIVAAARATSAFSAPTGASTVVTPIDRAGTYLVQLTVDSGSGLGALPGDVARISFYAGLALDPDPRLAPRRIPAFGETLEHNVPDAVDAGGNPDGWAREWLRWFALINALFDSLVELTGARITLPAGGPAAIVRSHNVASATRTAVGAVDVVFTDPMPDSSYTVDAYALGSGQASVDPLTIATTGFTLYRADPFGVAVDGDFGFRVDLRT